MANAQRGEIEAVLDGRRHVLCLTLGALAELEAAFGADDLADLARRFEGGRLKARDLTLILTAGLRGGGAELDEAAVSAMRIEGGLGGVVRIVGRLIAATFADSGAGDQAPANPPRPQA